jgi:hypothetical protein
LTIALPLSKSRTARFEALRQFDEKEWKTALEVLEGLILKPHAGSQ